MEGHRLLLLVYGCKALHDPNDPNYNNADKVYNCWKQIAKHMRKPVAACQDQFFSMIEKFNNDTRYMGGFSKRTNNTDGGTEIHESDQEKDNESDDSAIDTSAAMSENSNSRSGSETSSSEDSDSESDEDDCEQRNSAKKGSVTPSEDANIFHQPTMFNLNSTNTPIAFPDLNTRNEKQIQQNVANEETYLESHRELDNCQLSRPSTPEVFLNLDSENPQGTKEHSALTILRNECENEQYLREHYQQTGVCDETLYDERGTDFEDNDSNRFQATSDLNTGTRTRDENSVISLKHKDKWYLEKWSHQVEHQANVTHEETDHELHEADNCGENDSFEGNSPVTERSFTLPEDSNVSYQFATPRNDILESSLNVGSGKRKQTEDQSFIATVSDEREENERYLQVCSQETNSTNNETSFCESNQEDNDIEDNYSTMGESVGPSESSSMLYKSVVLISPRNDIQRATSNLELGQRKRIEGQGTLETLTDKYKKQYLSVRKDLKRSVSQATDNHKSVEEGNDFEGEDYVMAESSTLSKSCNTSPASITYIPPVSNNVSRTSAGLGFGKRRRTDEHSFVQTNEIKDEPDFHEVNQENDCSQDSTTDMEEPAASTSSTEPATPGNNESPPASSINSPEPATPIPSDDDQTARTSSNPDTRNQGQQTEVRSSVAAAWEKYLASSVIQLSKNNNLKSFFSVMADTVQTFPRELQVEVKSKIFQIVNEGELKCLQRVNIPYNCTSYVPHPVRNAGVQDNK